MCVCMGAHFKKLLGNTVHQTCSIEQLWFITKDDVRLSEARSRKHILDMLNLSTSTNLWCVTVDLCLSFSFQVIDIMFLFKMQMCRSYQSSPGVVAATAWQTAAAQVGDERGEEQADGAAEQDGGV